MLSRSAEVGSTAAVDSTAAADSEADTWAAAGLDADPLDTDSTADMSSMAGMGSTVGTDSTVGSMATASSYGAAFLIHFGEGSIRTVSSRLRTIRILSTRYGLTLDSDLKVKITPKDAQVFVDGYYAGVSDNFDGAFQRLHVTPGGHVITIYRDGYRTTSQSIYARPGSTATVSDRLQPLAPGEVSAPPVAPASPTVAPVDPQPPSDDSDQ